VVVQENHANPTFAVQGSLPAGRVLEPKEKPGLARLTASMLTRGTQKRSALEFAAALENVGATLTTSADDLTASITGQAQSKDFDLVMDLMAEMLRQPAFPQADFERAKGEQAAELEQERDSPSTLAQRSFQRAVYREGNPLRPPDLPEAQRGLEGITREDAA